jgi:hypothetical protein
MVTTTDRTWGRKVTDNVSDHNALLNTLKRKGKIKTVSGGYEIAEPIDYAENATYQRYIGYEALNTGASDVLTSVRYPYQQVALHVTASGRELRMNSGKEQMINLVKARKENALRIVAGQSHHARSFGHPIIGDLFLAPVKAVPNFAPIGAGWRLGICHSVLRHINAT